MTALARARSRGSGSPGESARLGEGSDLHAFCPDRATTGGRTAEGAHCGRGDGPERRGLRRCPPCCAIRHSFSDPGSTGPADARIVLHPCAFDGRFPDLSMRGARWPSAFPMPARRASAGFGVAPSSPCVGEPFSCSRCVVSATLAGIGGRFQWQGSRQTLLCLDRLGERSGADAAGEEKTCGCSGERNQLTSLLCPAQESGGGPKPERLARVRPQNLSGLRWLTTSWRRLMFTPFSRWSSRTARQRTVRVETQAHGDGTRVKWEFNRVFIRVLRGIRTRYEQRWGMVRGPL